MAAATMSPPAIHYRIDELMTKTNDVKQLQSYCNSLSFFNNKYNPNFYINRRKILELNSVWQEETLFLSDISEITKNENFQEIVKLGKDAIPVILEEIDINPSTLVWALNQITQSKISELPISVEEACKMWVVWGKNNKVMI